MSILRGLFCFHLFFAIVVLSTGQPNYCTICRDHTMCIYRNTRPACDAITFGLTPQQQTQIVNLHNSYRQKVASGNELRGSPGPQPPALFMPTLSWDTELADIAQTLANQCRYMHDACRRVQRFNVGQNIAVRSSTGSLTIGIETLIQMWYDEVARFDSRQVEHVTNFNNVGRYTQMLWATTTKVGCGYVNFKDRRWNTILLVCNYGPEEQPDYYTTILLSTIWTTGSAPAEVETLVTMWYNEVALFDSRQVKRVTHFDRVGHYTQMLWATTTKVGCGYLNYMNGNRNTVLLVCNYGPAGNVVGGRVYEPV